MAKAKAISQLTRRHDKKGRSTGEHFGRTGKLNRPPDTPWTWLTRDLLSSPAWRSLSANARLLIDRVLVEHMSQGGAENGELVVTYADLVDWGIRRNSIAPAITEAVSLGLLELQPGRPSHITGRGHPHRFRVGWLPTRDGELPTSAWNGHASLASAKQAARQAREQGADARRRTAPRSPLPQNIEGSLAVDTGRTVSPARLRRH